MIHKKLKCNLDYPLIWEKFSFCSGVYPPWKNFKQKMQIVEKKQTVSPIWVKSTRSTIQWHLLGVKLLK